MANIKLNYAIVCELVSVDKTGKGNIIGTFDRIGSKGVPALHPRFSVVVNTYGDAGEYNEKVELVNLENNETVVAATGKMEIKTGGKNNFVANFVNTAFPAFGKYWVKVTINNGTPITNPEIHYVSVVQA